MWTPRLSQTHGCYLSKFRLAKIWAFTNKSDYSDIERIKYDWTKYVYGDVLEIIPKDTPPSSWRLHHSHWPTIKMQTSCTMTLLQVAPSLVSCTSWTRCLSTGSLRNKPPSKRQRTGENSFHSKLHWPDCWSTSHPKVSQCSNQGHELHVWG
jgi:hypothetical protein